jgi:hypothetical protein
MIGITYGQPPRAASSSHGLHWGHCQSMRARPQLAFKVHRIFNPVARPYLCKVDQDNRVVGGVTSAQGICKVQVAVHPMFKRTRSPLLDESVKCSPEAFVHTFPLSLVLKWIRFSRIDCAIERLGPVFASHERWVYLERRRLTVKVRHGLGDAGDMRVFPMHPKWAHWQRLNDHPTKVIRPQCST